MTRDERHLWTLARRAAIAASKVYPPNMKDAELRQVLEATCMALFELHAWSEADGKAAAAASLSSDDSDGTRA